MNRSISKLFVVVVLLFTILIVFTSRWTVFDQTALQNNPLNKLEFYASLKIKRGEIIADNGAVLAKSVSAGGGTWKRDYPFSSLFAQAIGYAIPQEGELAGLERSRNQELSGKLETGLSSVFGPLSTATVGDDVYTTLDPKAQELARTELAGRPGSVVAIVPQTGAVKVLYSNPTYNDNDPSACPKTPGCSEYNDATEGGFPPGSTFKVVTTAAALNTGLYTPNSTFNGPSPLEVSGAPLENDGDVSYHNVSLTYALTNSINTIYAQVGEHLGAQTLQQYMQRFGFYSKPPMDYPSGEMLASGERIDNKLVPVSDPHIDLGRTAIGQANLVVTPLQMAMVASAVADGGKLMKPRLTSKVVNQYGQVVESTSPIEDDQVMQPKIASELTQMMTDVVEEGTGQAANLDGVKVAGKTGTASITNTSGGSLVNGALDDAWFIGFAPVTHPKIAVAVELTGIPNGYGGTYAAPIAAQEIKTLLAENQ